ncbi:phosphoenolpyruvate-protein phosphotransferase [Gemmatirosa kalamazoonensis]|uniref:Phosphoenolpyruvate-protein phosphotransferase n=1 Tax=Gemmatirosa kalamazoonensis TaxID=861299 RepID=W0RHS7_9BACT|nr:phosphoenolpyruvate--protein phosphotransferase [Gemmatirosa kalamazoonensis]AHG90664.1 phosphoenolpyruvate-protein phosphotransferase [Gemmatirosa kalamazoonensis]
MSFVLRGIPASPGIVTGPVHLLRWEVPDVPHRIVPDEAIPRELARLHDAIARARDRLESVRARAERHAGAEEAAIFDVQLTILQDAEILTEIEGLVRQNLGAEKAVDLAMLEWRRRFERSPHAMLRERVGDLVDVQIRVLTALLGLPDHDPVDVPKGTCAVLVTHDLTPSLTVQLDREAISAIATDAGTNTSHIAILARSLGLPAVVGLRDATSRLTGTETIVLDGGAGTLTVDPTDAEVAAFQVRAQLEAQEVEELRLLASAEPVTLDGEPLVLRANVDLPEEAEQAANSGADGVGLMRTEFLVVGRATMPDEDEQYRAYARVVDAFGGHPVVIRTFDVGGDKLPVGGFPVEPNPFLGWRAIRMCLDEPELFKTQLRALLRAATHGDVRIMLPLVVTVEEVREARALMEESAAELRARGVPHRDDVALGVMIETPAAAVSVDTFAGEVAFFSIGTNDLVQYTLAVDRGNALLAPRFTPLHPAVLRLIARTVEVAHDNNIEVAVCGEMASQPLMAFALIGLGLRQLSVAARNVPAVKRIVRGIHASRAADAARRALRAGTAAEAERILLEALERELGRVTA